MIFQVLEAVRQSSSPFLLLSDGESFLLGREEAFTTLWIWTEDGISEKKTAELCDYIYQMFSLKGFLRFAAKPAMAERISSQFLQKKHALCSVIQMESYECPNLPPWIGGSVLLQHPRYGEVWQAAECFSAFQRECFGEYIGARTLLGQARESMQNREIYLCGIKKNGKLLSLAKSSRRTDTHVAIGCVYTRPEVRGRGCGAAVISHLCHLIFQEGRLPVLYADVSCRASNRVYQKLGFQKRGRIDEYTLKW